MEGNIHSRNPYEVDRGRPWLPTPPPHTPLAYLGELTELYNGYNQQQAPACCTLPNWMQMTSLCALHQRATNCTCPPSRYDLSTPACESVIPSVVDRQIPPQHHRNEVGRKIDRAISGKQLPLTDRELREAAMIGDDTTGARSAQITMTGHGQLWIACGYGRKNKTRRRRGGRGRGEEGQDPNTEESVPIRYKMDNEKFSPIAQ